MIFPDLTYELPFWQAGMEHLAGLDEAGRGAWAGPVAAAAVILPANPEIAQKLSGVRDSKQMTPNQRMEWAVKIKAAAIAWAVGFAENDEIDLVGIVPATRLAMQRALDALAVSPQYLLLDAVLLREVDLSQTALIKGDVLCLSIAAASVLAKTNRDALMIKMDEQYPGYGFSSHKGYGTAAHRQALQLLGDCPIHRRSFAPVRFIYASVGQKPAWSAPLQALELQPGV